jgi:hypothetical protein
MRGSGQIACPLTDRPMRRLESSGTALLMLIVVAASPCSVRGDAGPLATARPHDPVVIRTAALTQIVDRDPTRYRLYVASPGRPVPIPFQVDARDAQGRYIFDETPSGAVGAPFDDDDELVFMAKDTGPRIASECLPGGSPPSEIEVRDPVTGARGYAYFVRDPGGPQPTETPYVAFDVARSEVRATYYRLQYPPGRNFFTRLQVTDAAGGHGDTLIDRMSLRINPTFSLLSMRWSPELTEESFITTIDGVRNGPVRAIVRARQSLDLGRVLPDPPAGTMNTVYYFSSFATPSTFEVPDLALKVLRDFRFEGTFVLGGAGPETRYFDAKHPAGIEVATRTPPSDLDRDHDWYVIDGPGGTYAQTFVIPESWRTWGVARGAVLRRDESGHPAAGYTLRNMTQLRASGAYDLLVSIVVLDRRYRPGDEQAVLGMVYRPLDVQVRPLAAGPPLAKPVAPPQTSPSPLDSCRARSS